MIYFFYKFCTSNPCVKDALVGSTALDNVSDHVYDGAYLITGGQNLKHDRKTYRALFDQPFQLMRGPVDPWQYFRSSLSTIAVHIAIDN